MKAKESILASIREANTKVNAAPQTFVLDSASGLIDAAAICDLFCQRLSDYGVVVHRCSASNLNDTLVRIVQAHQKDYLVLPSGLTWVADLLGENARVDKALSVAQLDEADGVITACALAIAETGTLVLNGAEDQGRRALSLVPDWHLCIVREEQLVADVPSAMHGLQPFAEQGMPLTFISGPSATADIEFQRVQGVHGPRVLEVMFISND